jgi:hypothetical protein
MLTFKYLMWLESISLSSVVALSFLNHLIHCKWYKTKIYMAVFFGYCHPFHKTKRKEILSGCYVLTNCNRKYIFYIHWSKCDWDRVVVNVETSSLHVRVNLCTHTILTLAVLFITCIISGNISRTINNRTCQHWNTDTPHNRSESVLDPESFPDGSISDAANYCRNPGGIQTQPWCYITDPEVEWEFCDVGGKCRRSDRELLLQFMLYFVAFFVISGTDPRQTRVGENIFTIILIDLFITHESLHTRISIFIHSPRLLLVTQWWGLYRWHIHDNRWFHLSTMGQADTSNS